MINFTGDRPIFLQGSESIEDGILSGVYPEESQIPSTTEIAASCRINPATALKGISLLVEEGIIYKKRGLGMFVVSGAKGKIREKRKREFYEKYVVQLIDEAKKLGFSEAEITYLIRRGFEGEH